MAGEQNKATTRFAIQASEGTPASTSAYGLILAGGTMPQTRANDEVYREADGLQVATAMHRSEAWVEGAPEYHVYPRAFGALMYLLFGADNVTGSEDPYSHAMTPADQPPFATVWTDMAGLYWERLVDMRVSQVVIKGSSGSRMTVAVTWVGKKGTHLTAGETTATLEITQIFRYYDGRGALKVEGAAIAAMREYELTFNRNMSRQGGDSLTPSHVDPGAFDVTCQATMRITSASLRNRIMYGGATPDAAAEIVSDVLEAAGSPAGLEFTHTRVAASPGPERSIKLAVPRVAVSPFEVPITPGEPGALYVPLTFTGLKGGDPISTATIKNSVASYVPA